MTWTHCAHRVLTFRWHRHANQLCSHSHMWHTRPSTLEGIGAPTPGKLALDLSLASQGNEVHALVLGPVRPSGHGVWHCGQCQCGPLSSPQGLQVKVQVCMAWVGACHRRHVGAHGGGHAPPHSPRFSEKPLLASAGNCRSPPSLAADATACPPPMSSPPHTHGACSTQRRCMMQDRQAGGGAGPGASAWGLGRLLQLAQGQC